jgi:hypothetical protein
MTQRWWNTFVEIMCTYSISSVQHAVEALRPLSQYICAFTFSFFFRTYAGLGCIASSSLKINLVPSAYTWSSLISPSYWFVFLGFDHTLLAQLLTGHPTNGLGFEITKLKHLTTKFIQILYKTQVSTLWRSVFYNSNHHPINAVPEDKLVAYLLWQWSGKHKHAAL